MHIEKKHSTKGYQTKDAEMTPVGVVAATLVKAESEVFERQEILRLILNIVQRRNPDEYGYYKRSR